MMKTKIEELKSAINIALKNYRELNPENFLSDLHIFFDEDNDALTFFDDVENQLYSINWTETEKETISLLKKTLQEQDKDGFFNQEFIFKPFSANLIDENFLINEELIFIDDENIQLDNNIWSALDKELDDFFNNLMKN